MHDWNHITNNRAIQISTIGGALTNWLMMGRSRFRDGAM
jgi:hypothetical protein